MAWVRVGSVTVLPETTEAVVGVIDVPPQNGVELMIRQVNPPAGFRFAYGLVSLVTVRGRELGTVKAWADSNWAAFRLGDGLSCLSGSGQLTFQPRAINLRWVKAGFPWTVEFMADIGYDLPPDRYQSTGFQDQVGRLLQLVRTGSQGRLRF